MDDIVTSTESQHDAMLLKEQLNVILSKGKFAVKGWHSNCSFVDEFPDETLTTVLGHDWDKHHDTLRPNFPDIDARKLLTNKILGPNGNFCTDYFKIAIASTGTLAT